MKILPIHLSTTYPIYFANDVLHTTELADYCAQLNMRLVIMTDSHLVDSYGKNLLDRLKEKNLRVELLSFPAGEMHKTREIKHKLEDELFAKQCGRDTCLLALGGGVVTDMVGFIAATYCRGIPVIYIPTSLLAMVDASIGGKTGVNTQYGKNLIGNFSQPLAVFIDTHLLRSLPEKEWHNGTVEMIKHSVIADAEMFTTLQNNRQKMQKRDADFLTEIIYANCVIKKNIVEQDEKEQGMRQLLNFGHTIGHAIETIENYRVSHGEAVAIGMLVESHISMQCGYLSETAFTALRKMLFDYGLSLQTAAFHDKNIFQETLILDKKTKADVAHFVLLDAIGKPHIHNGSYTQSVDSILLHQALDWAGTL